jgi:hypothetical protein
MTRGMCVAVLSFLGLGLSTIATAETIKRESASVTETIECRGRSFDLDGADNTFTLLGECPSVSINGTTNTVRVESVGSISINGMGNKVVWGSAIGGAKPRVSLNGLGNSARQGSVGGDSGARREKPPASRETTKAAEASSGGGSAESIQITDSHVDRTITCNGTNVSVLGSHCELRLKGECGKVALAGSHNTLDVESAGRIEVTGSYNTVTWKRGPEGRRPQIANLGQHNVISQATD